MSAPPTDRLDPMDLVRELTALPHRGAGTAQERRAADILSSHLLRMGAIVDLQTFTTPNTYIWTVWWMVGGIVIGLLLTPIASWWAFLLVAVSTLFALLHFDWRDSPILRLPPLTRSQNVIGRLPTSTPSGNKLILMGHYDSAPASLLYSPSMVSSFRRSLLISLALMVLASLVTLLDVVRVGQPVLGWLRYLLAAYFVAQGVLSTVDYLRYGYTNGASDNATGAAAAVATASRLWSDPMPGWDVEVVLTGAEEVGMVGAAAFHKAHRNELATGNTYVLNFDNVGAGHLRVITRTGSITSIRYDNALVRAALETAATDSRFATVKAGVWHTGDFDSAPFARGGVPALTLSAQDDAGQIAHLHRTSDTMENVDGAVPRLAVDLAEATARRLAQSLAHHKAPGGA